MLIMLNPPNLNEELFNVIMCLLIGPLFRFYGRNLSNVCIGFMKNWRHQKIILRLTLVKGYDPIEIFLTKDEAQEILKGAKINILLHWPRLS